MGDDLSRPERLAVRTPMQWSSGHNAGFSAAPADRLVAPVVDDPAYAPASINVEAQLADPDSLLSRTQRLIRARQGLREITGSSRVVETGAPGVFGLRYDDAETGSFAVLLTNVGQADARITLPVAAGTLVDVLSDRAYDPPVGDPAAVDIAGHGYRWLRSREPLLAPA